MITQETAALIWNAHQEIKCAENLLDEIKKTQEEHQRKRDDPCIPATVDVLWENPNFQFSHYERSLNISPILVESVIRAHIEYKRKELAAENERARVELGIPAEATAKE
jgi:hypothetical protein